MPSVPQPRLVNNRYALIPNPRQGGMAEVYAATDLHCEGKKVALKLFKQEYTQPELLAEAFRRESEALRELRHPGILELYDAGVDSQTTRHFLVLEWIDKDLVDWRSSASFPGWDSFYNDFGRPILEALAFAHTRQIIHRDIKPRNILVKPDGQPTIADFGIAKIKRWIQPSHTLQDWVSRPFSPPEFDDGSFTYSRDVYGFAALVLYCLTDIELKTYDDLETAIRELDVPDEIMGIIADCLATDPCDRFANAIVLLEEIDKVHERRAEHWAETTTYCLQLTKRATDSLKIGFPGESDQSIPQLVLEDLADVAGFAAHRPPKPEDSKDPAPIVGHFQLYGANIRYHVAIDERTQDRLVILNAWKSSSAQLENNRFYAFRPKCQFRFGQPTDPTKAASELRALGQAVEENEAELKIRESERREQELFQTWDRILKAKSEVERAKETPVLYDGWEQDGSRIHFHTAHLVSEELIGQPRRVVVENRALVIGEIESVDEKRITLHASDQYDTGLPKTGKLIFDVAAAQTAIRRQSDALDGIRFDRAVRPDLRPLLARPDRAKVPTDFQIQQFFQKEIDEQKKLAVRLACASPDFLVVQGPPGTGKTTFIAETVLQFLKQNPRARVLLTSQTHVALDNAAERIRALSNDTRILRLGLGSEEKSSVSVRDLLLPAQMDAWRTEVLPKGEKYLDGWAARHEISRHEFDVGRCLQEYLLHYREIENIEAKMRELRALLPNNRPRPDAEADGEQPSKPFQAPPEAEDVTALRDDIARYEAEVKRRKTEQKDLQARLKNLEPGAAEIVDGSISDIEEWIIAFVPNTPATTKFRELLDIRAEWESRFGKGPEFQAALIAAAQVIAGTCVGVVGVKGILDIDFDLCIVDEASKATATELLVPLSRSRRWVLVGDPKQLPPFEEEALQDDSLLSAYELKAQDLRDTLFERLANMLPQECRTALTVQHRMVPEIGNLISHCFYDGALESAREQAQNVFQRVLPKPVVWLTTSHLSAHREVKNEASYSNQSEARVIVKLLDALQGEARRAGEHFSVAILSGYLAQVGLLQFELSSRLVRWGNLEVEINTVDAFQGREADVAVYSVTRSNRDGNIGFLRDFRRLNVALSRGRDNLVIAGDHVFAKTVSGENPFRRIVEYIENHPSDCDIRHGTL